MKLILNAIGALLALPLGGAAVHKPKPQTRKPGRRLTQADHDAIAAAEAKRERKAKKLRRAA